MENIWVTAVKAQRSPVKLDPVRPSTTCSRQSFKLQVKQQDWHRYYLIIKLLNATQWLLLHPLKLSLRHQ